MFQFRLLGTAAGGGVPQWNCSCSICTLSRSNPEIVSPRYHLQAAVWNSPDAVFLLNASPDIRFQIEANLELQSSVERGNRNTPIQGIVLTGADLDQTLGLLLLREFQPLTIYSTSLVRKLLEANTFFRTLERVPHQLTWIEIEAGFPFVLGTTGIVCTPIGFDGEVPAYAREIGFAHSQQATLGVLLEHRGYRLAYTPSVPKITATLKDLYAGSDAIFVDGTFWSDGELSRTQPGTPLARSIGHVPMSGEDGSLALLAGVRIPQRVFVHLNNTNPVLDPRSDEYRTVIDSGWQIGSDGWELRRL